MEDGAGQLLEKKALKLLYRQLKYRLQEQWHQAEISVKKKKKEEILGLTAIRADSMSNGA